METSYTCRDAFQRLGDYLDRELAPDEQAAVQRHLDECLACAREFAFEASLLAALKHKLRRLKLPQELPDRVAAAVAAERKRPPSE